LMASSSSASSSATPSLAAVDKAKSMSKQEMADDVPMRDASNLSVELDNHRKKINETEQELSEVKIKVKSKLDKLDQDLNKVNSKLDKLDQDLNEVKSKLDKLEGKEGAGTLSDIEQKHLERLREDKRQLQTKEAQLQTEKLLLLEKEKELRENEKELRRALTSSMPYSSAASAAVPGLLYDVLQIVQQTVPNAQPGILHRMYQRCSARLLVAAGVADQKQRTMLINDLYEECERLPQTSTEVHWRAAGLLVNGSWHNHISLVICWELASGKPKLLKLLNPNESARIGEFMKRIVCADGALSLPATIVPFSLLASSDNRNRGMLMPVYPLCLDDGAVLPPHLVERLFDSLSASFGFLHSVGFAHMDVKPANIFVDQDGQYVLGDLGSIARFDTKSASTMAYLPKDKRDRPASAAVDWWMTALTIYDLSIGVDSSKRLGLGAFDPDSQYFLEVFAKPDAEQYIPKRVLDSLLLFLKDKKSDV